MAYEFYVTIEATKQGRLAGESTRDVHKGKLPGIGLGYEVKSPRDAATGPGERQAPARPRHVHEAMGRRVTAAVGGARHQRGAQDVALTFHAIEITNVDGRTTASDSIVGGQ